MNENIRLPVPATPMLATLMLTVLVLTVLMVGACATPPKRAPEPPPPPPVAIVRQVHAAERFLVYEAEFRMPSGGEMHLLRDGRRAGRVRVTRFRRRSFQAADILQGRPRVGDLLEPIFPDQPQGGQQGQGGGLGPQNSSP